MWERQGRERRGGRGRWHGACSSQEVQHSSAGQGVGERRTEEGNCRGMPLTCPAHHQLTRPRLLPAPSTIPSHPPPHRS